MAEYLDAVIVRTPTIAIGWAARPPVLWLWKVSMNRTRRKRAYVHDMLAGLEETPRKWAAFVICLFAA